jgi:succinate dehydrogenase/fumarate reductase flavoprotein subunit
MNSQLQMPPSGSECDVLVIGAGAAGLSAAIAARVAGATVLVVEKEGVVGGAAARSGGQIWAPGSKIARAGGVVDSTEAALQYLQNEAGALFDRERALAYLDAAPRMVDEYSAKTTEMRFVLNPLAGDAHPNLPGAAASGRVLMAPEFDARKLGRRLGQLAAPLKEWTFLGMQIGPGKELNHFFNWYRSFESARVVASRVARLGRDLLTHRRTTRLVNGQALVARLFKSAIDLGIEIRTGTPVVRLTTVAGRVTGALLDIGGQHIEVSARRGVVLACGGFPHDPTRRKELQAGPLRHAYVPLAPKGNSGDGVRLALEVGAVVDRRLPNALSWTPVSQIKTRSGVRVFPHLIDKGKPGFIAVDTKGHRFCNESGPGNDFVRRMAERASDDSVSAYLVFDHAAMRRWGAGMVRPAPLPFRHHLRSGYLMRGRTIRDLARSAGIDESGLEQTIVRFNQFARTGKDADFQRGESVADKRNGDPACKPNPALRELNRGPFYAIRLDAGDFSTLSGLAVDERCRVLDDAGRPITGLYAAGNDATSMMGGSNISPGSTLGPALVFGYIAARDLTSSPRDTEKGSAANRVERASDAKAHESR